MERIAVSERRHGNSVVAQVYRYDEGDNKYFGFDLSHGGSANLPTFKTQAEAENGADEHAAHQCNERCSPWGPPSRTI